MSNSRRLVEVFSVRCTRDHAHAPLISSRTVAAQQYPPAFCKAMVEAFAKQMEEDANLSKKNRMGNFAHSTKQLAMDANNLEFCRDREDYDNGPKRACGDDDEVDDVRSIFKAYLLPDESSRTTTCSARSSNGPAKDSCIDRFTKQPDQPARSLEPPRPSKDTPPTHQPWPALNQRPSLHPARDRGKEPILC